MNLFPAEIHCRIASFLTIEDLRSYRLVSKKQADIGAEYLFQVFNFQANDTSPRRAHHLAKNKSLQRIAHKWHYKGSGTLHDGDKEAININAFREVLETFTQSGFTIRSLRADHLHYAYFEPEYFPISYEQIAANITNLNLLINVLEYFNIMGSQVRGSTTFQDYESVLYNGLLRRFLAAMRNLKALKLEFQTCRLGSAARDYRYNPHPVPSIVDIIPLNSPWPFLRKLCLAQCETTGEFLVQLLECHAASLRVLQLKNMYICDSISWEQILKDMPRYLSLKSASFLGWLKDASGSSRQTLWPGEMSIFAEQLAHYVVKGGSFPMYIHTGLL